MTMALTIMTMKILPHCNKSQFLKQTHTQTHKCSVTLRCALILIIHLLITFE